MGHRSCIVRHRPTTLPGALSRTHAHRCLGRADKKRASSRWSRSPRSTTHVIIFEGRSGGSIGAALRLIIHLLLVPRDGSIVRLFQPIFIPHGFDELYDRVHERATVGPIVRSVCRPRSTITISGVFETRSGKSINEFAESSVRGQARVTGISNEYQTCKSINEFETRSRILERPGGPSTSNAPVAAGVERSFGSLLILSNIIGFPVELSIRFVKSTWRKNNKNWLERIVDFKKRISIIARLIFAFHRLSNEQTIIRVEHVSIFLDKLSEPVNHFFQPAILKTINFYETICFSFFSSRKSLIHIAAPFRAAVMMSGRRTSFR